MNGDVIRRIIGCFVILLPLVLGASFLLWVNGVNSHNPATVQAGGYQGIQPIGGDLPATFSQLNVFYRDNYRRDNLIQTQQRLYQQGLIHEVGAANWANPDFNYDGFGSVIGVRGAFEIYFAGSTVRRVSGNNFIRIEFARPVEQGDSLEFTHRSWLNPGLTNSRADFNLTFDAIGTFRVSIFSFVNGDERENNYYITVRNGRLDEQFEVGITFRPRSNSFNTERFSSVAIEIETEGNFFSISTEFNPDAINWVQFPEQETTIHNMFNITQQGARLGLARRNREVVIAPGQYRLQFVVNVTTPIDIDEDGYLIENQTTILTKYLTMNFFDPPPPRGRNWMPFLIALIVLIALAGLYYVVTNFVKKSQLNTVGRMERNLQERDRAEAKNRELLGEGESDLMDELDDVLDVLEDLESRTNLKIDDEVK
ncbi:MAG: hypothetical protein FWE16_02880 [Firmicutes bacterium]|nr:hypothetical protein [Bacillota bacterium]